MAIKVSSCSFSPWACSPWLLPTPRKLNRSEAMPASARPKVTATTTLLSMLPPCSG